MMTVTYLLLALCIISTETASNNCTAPSYRLFDHVLIGAAQVVIKAKDFTHCVAFCSSSHKKFKFNCQSGVFYYQEEDQNCILNLESRRTRSDLLVKEDKEKVEYFEIQCESYAISKRQVRTARNRNVLQLQNPNYGNWTMCDRQLGRHMRFKQCRSYNPNKCQQTSSSCDPSKEDQYDREGTSSITTPAPFTSITTVSTGGVTSFSTPSAVSPGIPGSPGALTSPLSTPLFSPGPPGSPGLITQTTPTEVTTLPLATTTSFTTTPSDGGVQPETTTPLPTNGVQPETTTPLPTSGVQPETTTPLPTNGVQQIPSMGPTPPTSTVSVIVQSNMHGQGGNATTGTVTMSTMRSTTTSTTQRTTVSPIVTMEKIRKNVTSELTVAKHNTTQQKTVGRIRSENTVRSGHNVTSQITSG